MVLANKLHVRILNLVHGLLLRSALIHRCLPFESVLALFGSVVLKNLALGPFLGLFLVLFLIV